MGCSESKETNPSLLTVERRIHNREDKPFHSSITQINYHTENEKSARQNFISVIDDKLLDELGIAKLQDAEEARGETERQKTDRHEEGGEDNVQRMEEESRCITADIYQKLREQCAQVGNEGRWIRLYASWRDGRSFNRCVNSIMGYPGISVIAIRSSADDVIGAVCNSLWKESGHLFFGSPSSFLFSATPHFRVFKATGKGDSFMLLNTRNQFYPKGMGFGGRPGCCRLWIDDDYSKCYATNSDRTFASGALITEQLEEEFLRTFAIEELEVWAAGEEEDLIQQQESLARDEQTRQERRLVDKARFLDSDFDREYFLSNTFSRTTAQSPLV